MISEEMMQTIMSYMAGIVILIALVFELYFFCLYAPKDEDGKKERIISRIIGLAMALPLLTILLFVVNEIYKVI